MRQSSRAVPAAEVERREILLEGLIDVGSRALHDRLEPAEPHRDQFPNAGLSIRPSICAWMGTREGPVVLQVDAMPAPAAALSDQLDRRRCA
jgi:hypothetical protein